jgi:hypothetical protein
LRGEKEIESDENGIGAGLSDRIGCFPFEVGERGGLRNTPDVGEGEAFADDE